MGLPGLFRFKNLNVLSFVARTTSELVFNVCRTLVLGTLVMDGVAVIDVH